MTDIHKRIKSRREELGISQEELAFKLGYKSRSTIAKIESGENDIPQSKISAFATALRTTPAWLMGWIAKDFTVSQPAITSPETALPEAYLRVAQHAKDQKLTPDDLRKLIDIWVNANSK